MRCISGTNTIPDDDMFVGVPLEEKVITIGGKGGAAHVDGGRVDFTHCEFFNNHGVDKGDSIYADPGTTIKIEQCNFETIDQSNSATIIFGQGTLIVINSSMIIRAFSHAPKCALGWFNGDIQLSNILVQCLGGAEFYNFNLTHGFEIQDKPDTCRFI